MKSLPKSNSRRERIFDAWACFILGHRAAVALAVILITIVFGYITTQLPLLTTLRDFLPGDAPGLTEWEEARDRFGGDEITLLAVESDDHFTPAGIEKIQQATDLLLEHPYVENVTSLATIQQIKTDPNDPDGLLVEDLIRPNASPQEIRKAALADSNIRKVLVSLDGRSITFVVQAIPNNRATALLPLILEETNRRTEHLPNRELQRSTPDGERRLLEATKQSLGLELQDMIVSAGYKPEQIDSAGFPVLISSMLSSAEANMKKILPLSALLLALALFLQLRRLVDSILPLICVGPAILWAVGLGGAVFGRITLMTTVAPIMVLVVGVSDVVHLVTQFRHEIARGYGRNDAIRIAFREVGSACVLTSITTFLGFATMLLLPLPGSRELGFFAGIGVVTAFLLSFLLTPIFLSFTPAIPKKTTRVGNDLLSPLLKRLDLVVQPRSKSIVLVGCIVTAITMVAVSQIPVENLLTHKFDEDHPTRLAVTKIEALYGGTGELEFLIDTGRQDGMKSPDVMRALIDIEEWALTHPDVTNTHSITTLLQDMHGVLAPDSLDSIPTSQNLIAQYLLLFEASGGDSVESLLDETNQYARMTLRTNNSSAEEFIELADQLDAKAKELFPAGVQATSNGLSLHAARVGPTMLDQTITGLGTTIVFISILLGFFFRSLRIGVFSVVPNLLPVAAAILTAWFMHDRVDVDSLNFLPICIGIAVDDTIHFLSRYRIEREKGFAMPNSVKTTMVEAGHGILRTSLVLSVGFSVITLADYTGSSIMGWMLPVSLMVAVGLDLTLVPAMTLLGLLEPGAGDTPETPNQRHQPPIAEKIL